MFSSMKHGPGARSRARSVGVVLTAMMLIGVLGTACQPSEYPYAGTNMAGPASQSPLRYIDPIFPTHTVTSDIIYSSPRDLSGTRVDLKLDIYQPQGDTATVRPVVVVAHGGGLIFGSKTTERAPDMARYLVERGYVVASIDYRKVANTICHGADGDFPPGEGCRSATLVATSDAQAAVRWLRANTPSTLTGSP